ncbi:MAG: glycosyltransferase family A protein [Porphyromonadaceae bacterium]|nr:glycosyltransferase family A protein [Porphyromonadaceae bacterium]
MMCDSSRPLVSVLIPVYKTERFIGRCIASIIKQDYRPLQVVLVDDCGGDNAMTIACEMLTDVEGITLTKVFHDKNCGVTTARRHSLEHAEGDYLLFLDSDDYWDAPGNVSHIIQEMLSDPDLDVVVTDYFADYPKRIKYMRVDCPSTSQATAKCLLQGHMPSFLWNKCFKKDSFLKYAGKFVDGVKLWEDFMVLVPFFANPIKLKYIHYSFVHYEQGNENSLIHTMDAGTLEKIIEAIRYCEQMIPNKAIYEEDIKCAYISAKAHVMQNVPLKDYSSILEVYKELDCYNMKRVAPLYSKVIFALQRKKSTRYLGFILNELILRWKYILRH